ncbi:hypothetical protein [Asaia sp. HN010]|uniref:hypothetical protein n=1 Tax=Asaia sp. HN010 TaxID=3081233 RepID=UPI003017C1C9
MPQPPQQQSGTPPDPMAMLQQQAEQLKAQVGQHLGQLNSTTTVDKVIRFLRDERVRAFTIEIETDSTVMADETAEKQSRGEFLQAFAQASSGVQQLLQLGQPGAQLAGGILRFSLAPYRAGRQLDAMIDEFTEKAPQIVAQQQQAQQPGGQDQQLMQAQQQIAQAELGKAQAQLQRVQADTTAKQAQNQLDEAKAQIEAQQRQQKAQMEYERLMSDLRQAEATLAETMARVEQIRTETAMMVENAQTSRQTADNDTARVIAEVGQQQFEHDAAIMQPVEALDVAP